MGAALGGSAGLALGRWIGHSKARASSEAQDAYLTDYAKIYAKVHGIKVEEAKDILRKKVKMRR